MADHEEQASYNDLRAMTADERRRRYPRGVVVDHRTLPQEILDRAQRRMDEAAERDAS